MTLLNSTFSEIIKSNPLLTKQQEFDLSKKAKSLINFLLHNQIINN